MVQKVFEPLKFTVLIYKINNQDLVGKFKLDRIQKLSLFKLQAFNCATKSDFKDYRAIGVDPDKTVDLQVRPFAFMRFK